MLKILDETNSIISQYIADMRNIKRQTSRADMRKYLRLASMMIGFEISKSLTYESISIDTPFGTSDSKALSSQVVIASILRAGLPMHNGLLEIFDSAESAFIGSYRKNHRDGSFEVASEYMSGMSLEGKTLIIADAMIATGSSMDLAIKSLIEEFGEPECMHIACLIGARPGYEYLLRRHPDVQYWIGSMDDDLTAKNYIVPGLGDAGDLCFGEKS